MVALEQVKQKIKSLLSFRLRKIIVLENFLSRV
jgi:hypothetical protein